MREQDASADPSLGTNETGLPLNLAQTAKIPDHELLRCIGRGSYGEVWLARNVMGSYRAVKIVFEKAFKDQRPFERELGGIQRFEPISRSHEGLVDVLHVGRNAEAGFLYYVMELGDDHAAGQNVTPERYVPRTLAKEVTLGGRLPFADCLQLGLILSSALGHLHKHGLIHRDVKPSNIIFVNGVPKLADIGLVTDIGEARSYVGTEGFIPPEGPGTPQADVYGLGKVLYEISMGKDRLEFPQLPADLTDSPDAKGYFELNEVIVKACQNDLTKRYPSAREMHADLMVLESGQSLHRLRSLERRMARLKRIAALALLTFLISALAYHQVYQKRKDMAETRQRQVGAQVANGTHAMETGDLLGALPFFVEALRLDQGDPLREATHRFRLGAVLAQCPKLTQLWSFDGRSQHAEFSPDGGQVLIVRWFGKAQLFDLTTGQAASPPFGQDQGLEAASVSPDGRQIVTASQDGTACVWDAKTGQPILTLPNAACVFGAQFSPAGDRVVTACKDSRARIWDLSTRKVVLELNAHADAVTHAEYSNDGQLIVTTSKDETALVWNARTGARLTQPLPHKSWVYHASFSPDGTLLVTAGFDRKARRWQMPGGRELLPAMNHGDAVRSARFSPDGRYIVTASWDSTVRLWDAETGQPLSQNALFKHSGRVMSAAFGPDGHRIVSACADGTVRVWELAANGVLPRTLRATLSADGSRFLATNNDSLLLGNPVAPLSESTRFVPQSPLQEAALNPNGDFVLAICAAANPPSARTLQVWSSSSGKPVSPSLRFTNSLNRTCLSDDGRRLISFGGKSVRRFEVRSGQELFPPLLADAPVTKAFFSPSADRLLTISGTVAQLWDFATGQEVIPKFNHATQISHAQFSPDGHRLVTCTADASINECSAQLWDADTGRAVGEPLRHRDGVLHASFSPDGRRVVTASEDFTAVVWDAATGKQLTPPVKHEDQVQEASFSQDGRRFATASSDRTCRVWDAETGEPLTPPLRHTASVWHARFLANGRYLVTARPNDAAWLWELPSDTRPVASLALLAQLLSGNQDQFNADAGPRANPPLDAQWRKLKAEYPGGFVTTQPEIIAWHLGETELSEKNGQWSAALFHLNKLLALRPGDPNLAQRQTSARQASLQPGKPDSNQTH
jgi:WD40 repeat protein